MAPALTFDECALRVRQAIARAQQLPLERLTPESSFEQLGIGSLDAINLVFVLEDTLGIDIPADQEGFETVGELIEAVHRHLNDQAAPPASASPPENTARLLDR